jgi:metallophosphoesterase superfamily enzyme
MYDKNMKVALEFFSKLEIAIGDRVKDIIIVPGNHDKKRDKNKRTSAHVIAAIDSGLKKDECDRWEPHLDDSKSFIEFSN